MRVREKTRTNSQIFKRKKTRAENRNEMASRKHINSKQRKQQQQRQQQVKTVSAAPHSRSNRKTRIVRLLIEVPLYGAFQSDQFKQR